MQILPLPEMNCCEQPLPDNDGDGNSDGTIQGGTSIAFGVPELLDEDATDDEIAAGRERLFYKLLAAFFIPSSLYSGKMQSFVQALYGADILQWRASLMLAANEFPRLVLDGIDLHWNYLDTAGIFTNEETYDYWLVRISNSGGLHTVTARAIVLNACAVELREYILFLRDNMAGGEWETFKKEQLPVLEQVLFSNSSLSPDAVILGTFNLAHAPHDQHGWKFNKLGTEAHLITHEMVMTGVTYVGRVARHGKVTLEVNGGYDPEDPSSKPLTMAYSLVETANYSLRPNGDLIHYYDYLLGITLTVVTPLTSVPGSGDAPIYCVWRNDDDGDEYLDVRRYSCEISTVAAPPSGYNTPPQLWSCCGCLSGCHDGYDPPYDGWPAGHDTSGVDIVDYVWGTVIHAGFYTPDHHDGRLEHGTNEYHRARALEIDAGAVPSPPAYTGFNYNHNTINGIGGNGCAYWGGFDPLPYRVGNVENQEFTYRELNYVDDRSLAATTFDTLLIIPSYDVNAYYDGHLETIGARSVIDNGPYNQTTGRTYFHYLVPGTPVGGFGVLQGGECWPQTASLASSGYLYDNSASYGTQYVVHVDLLTRDAVTEITDIVTEDYFGGVASWDAVFNPPMLVDPQIYFKFPVIHSLTDDFRAAGDVNEGFDGYFAKGDYPYMAQSNFIGKA